MSISTNIFWTASSSTSVKMMIQFINFINYIEHQMYQLCSIKMSYLNFLMTKLTYFYYLIIDQFNTKQTRSNYNIII